MRIERIEIFVTDLTARLQRQRSTGAYDTGAPGTLIGKPVLVKIFTEGIVGYGQIRPLAPHHSMPDTYASMISMIRDVCGKSLVGQRVFDVESVHAMFDRIAPANYMARAVIDCALYDAMGKATGRPVYDLIGGLAQPLIPLEWSISMADDPGRMVADAERAVHEFGIKVLCMKAGHPGGWRQDVENFAAIRRAVGSQVTVGMDANTGWSVTETLSVLAALKSDRVDYIEQPVKRHDLKGMAAIRRASTGVLLMADEACGSVQEAAAIVEAEAADVLCIKLYKHGGITPARKIAAIAEAAGLKINCGGLAVLSQLEAAASAHFYASRPADHVMPAGEFIFGLGVIGPDPLVTERNFLLKDGHVRPTRHTRSWSYSRRASAPKTHVAQGSRAIKRAWMPRPHPQLLRLSANGCPRLRLAICLRTSWSTSRLVSLILWAVGSSAPRSPRA
jgi:L-alanine-DL-glutamate epimerase-like enolase superfamily enzyme